MHSEAKIKTPTVISSQVRYHQQGSFIVIDDGIDSLTKAKDLIQRNIIQFKQERGYQLQFISDNVVTLEKKKCDEFDDIDVFIQNLEFPDKYPFEDNEFNCSTKMIDVCNFSNDLKLIEIGYFQVYSSFILVSDPLFKGRYIDKVKKGRWYCFYGTHENECGVLKVSSLYVIHSDYNSEEFKTISKLQLQICSDYIGVIDGNAKPNLDSSFNMCNLPKNPFIFNDIGVIAECGEGLFNVNIWEECDGIVGVKINFLKEPFFQEGFL